MPKCSLRPKGQINLAKGRRYPQELEVCLFNKPYFLILTNCASKLWLQEILPTKTFPLTGHTSPGKCGPQRHPTCVAKFVKSNVNYCAIIN